MYKLYTLDNEFIKNVKEMPSNFTGIAHYANFHKSWYQNGELHRKDGPAVEYTDSTKYWYFEGKLHRVGGPAVTLPGGDEYWFHGEIHRLDGPAVIRANGKKFYYIHGELFSEEQHKLLVDIMRLKGLL